MRVEATVDVTERQQVRLVYAPLQLTGRDTPILLSASCRWFGGYRTIEGGADVDAVYTFAWLNAIVGGIGVRF